MVAQKHSFPRCVCQSHSQISVKLAFERQGYFCVDLDSKPDALVFNRTVTLRDTWAKIEKKGL